MRAKHWLALFLVMAMAASLAIIPVTAEENLLAGTDGLSGTVTFTVEADRETVIYTGEEEVVTFTVEVANDSDEDLHAFSFYLEPSDRLTLATLDKGDEANADADFYFLHGTGTEADTEMLQYYKTFEYTPDRGYFGAAKADKTNTAATTEGSAITLTSGAKTVLTIMGKISAPDDYTLTMNTTDKDKVVVAGQVNGTGNNTVSQYFARQVTGATVHAVAGGVISGTVTDNESNAISDATVTLKKGNDVAATAKTDANGAYTLPAVANGSYTVNVTAVVGEKTLSGSKSVTVDKYAVDAGSITVQEFQKGDVNRDKEIGSDDVSLLMQYSVGNVTLDETQLSLGDINKNGEIDSGDISSLMQYLVGNLNSLD